MRINADQICQASNQPKEEILRIREQYDGLYDNVLSAKYGQSTYVDLKVAIELSRRYGLAGLEEKLRNLNGVPQEPVGQPGTIEFIETTGLPRPVTVRMSDFRVNASHIARLAGVSHDPTRVLRKKLGSEKFDLNMGDGLRRGTYVDFDIAIGLCHDYNLSELEKQLCNLKSTYKQPVVQSETSQARPLLQELNTIGPRNESEAEDSDEMDSDSDMESSEESIISHESSPIQQQSSQPVPSIRVTKDAKSSVPQPRRDTEDTPTLLDLSDLRPPAAKSIPYEVWDSESQHSALTEVRPESKPSSWRSASHYGSLGNLFE